jgi:hypothetical protein
VTKSAHLTSNQLLFYQICDYSKNIVLKKKSIDIELNIFGFKQKIRNFFTIFGNNPNTSNVKMYTDFIWLFKYKLYTNETFLHDIFSEFKAMQQKQLTNNFNLLRILRIFNEYLALYFDAKKVQSKLQNSDECSDDDSETEKNRSKEKIVLIKSPAYYRTINYEISLTCVKPFILKILSLNYDSLFGLEKFIYLINYNFAMRKNFLPTKTEHFNEEEYYLNLRKADENIFKPYIKCSVCMQSLEFFDQCLELKTIECNLGHKLKRCEKSLLLLNYKSYKCCFVCGCAWNAYDSAELPNLKDFFINSQNTCIYCN